MSKWRFDESILDLKARTESKKVKRTRKLMQLVRHRTGKVRARAIKELEEIYVESKLRIWDKEEIERVYGS